MAEEEIVKAIYNIAREEADVVNAVEDAVNAHTSEKLKAALDELDMSDMYDRYNDAARDRIRQCYDTLKQKIEG